jgi:hypothetical protein
MKVHHEQIQVGVFVYQILQSAKVRIRSYPDLLDEEETDDDPKRRGDFEVNELLAVDMIQPTRQATFLRLADQSGWVMADERGQVYMRQLQVETGLFSFYVDNVPHGVIVRRHPMDDASDLLVTESGTRLYRLPPLQRIYCDAVVQHPVTGVQFYRLQGGPPGAPATPGWVGEKKPAAQPGHLDHYYLLEAAKVKTGLFCYKAICGAFIRHRPICSESSKTSRAVMPHELVVVDVIRDSPYQNGNGPFLRLADGSGWLFEKKLGERAMIEVPIHTGHWVFAIRNEPVGMVLRQQPMDCQDRVFRDGIYPTGALVECDRKVTNSAGVNFYRVRGTAGWLFDTRNGVPLMTLIAEETTPPPTAEDDDTVATTPWAPDFVRGIAALVPGTHELPFQSAGQVLTLDNPDRIVVKVFCSTRCLCSIFQHSSKGTIKFFRRDCSPQDLLDTLKMDLIETILAYDKFVSAPLPPPFDGGEEKKEDGERVPPSAAAQVQDEETLRLRLLVCEAEILAAHAKRRELHTAIRKYDDRRAKIALWMKESTEKHRKAHEIVVPEKATKEGGRNTRGQAVAKTASANGSKYRSVSSRSNFSSTRSSYEYTDDEEEEEGDEYADDFTDEASRPHAPEHHHTAPADMDADTKGGGSQKAFACGECYRSFSGKYSRDIHCREVHKIYCEQCEKIFPSFQDLEMHRDNFNHW